MYELNKTHARRVFKNLLGQANHFLITILVGLDGVRTREVDISDEFGTSWNPKNKTRSADRSREFVLDLALIRAIDSLDSYFIESVRKPCVLNEKFEAAMHGCRRSVKMKLDEFNTHLDSLEEHHKEALKIAIDWRNRRVHSLAKKEVNDKTIRTVIDNKKKFKEGYCGLDIVKFVKHFEDGKPPSFKEATSVIRLTHEAVQYFDTALLKCLPIEAYIKGLMLRHLEQNNGNSARALSKTWGHPDPKKRDEKIYRQLRMVGVNKTTSVRGRQVPDEFISSVINLGSKDVIDFLEN